MTNTRATTSPATSPLLWLRIVVALTVSIVTACTSGENDMANDTSATSVFEPFPGFTDKIRPIDSGNSTLGINYTEGASTIVINEQALHLPWLAQSYVLEPTKDSPALNQMWNSKHALTGGVATDDERLETGWTFSSIGVPGLVLDEGLRLRATQAIYDGHLNDEAHLYTPVYAHTITTDTHTCHIDLRIEPLGSSNIEKIVVLVEGPNTAPWGAVLLTVPNDDDIAPQVPTRRHYGSDIIQQACGTIPDGYPLP